MQRNEIVLAELRGTLMAPVAARRNEPRLTSTDATITHVSFLASLQGQNSTFALISAPSGDPHSEHLPGNMAIPARRSVSVCENMRRATASARHREYVNFANPKLST